MKKLTKKDHEERLEATDVILSYLLDLMNNSSNSNHLKIYTQVYEYVDKINWDYVIKASKI